MSMDSSLHSLTQSELLALALDATKRDAPGNAVRYLKAAVARDDATAEAAFLLGSEYAQLGLLDAAEAMFARAVDLAPDRMAIARFQWGLLRFAQGQPDKALSVWAPLATLDQQHPDHHLALLSRGLQHMAADELDAALTCLNAGMVANPDNPPLNAEIRRLVEQMMGHAPTPALAARPDTQPTAAGQPAELHTTTTPPIPATPGTAPDDAGLEPNHLFISAYAGHGKSH